MPETEVRTGDAHAAADSPESDALFLRACRREPVERTPIWIMRQAGRYLPEYRAVRERARLPDLLPHAGAGLRDHVAAGHAARGGRGDPVLRHPRAARRRWACTSSSHPAPQLAQPIRGAADVASLRVPDAREATPFVLEAMRLIRRATGRPRAAHRVCRRAVHHGHVPRRGRRLASSLAAIKELLFSDPAHGAPRCSGSAPTRSASYLAEQVRAGAQAAMLFDTWAGSARSRRRPAPSSCPMRPARARSGPGGSRATPAWPACRSSTTPAMPPGGSRRVPDTGADVIGLDWRIDLDAARARVGGEVAAPGQPRSGGPARTATLHPPAYAATCCAPRAARPSSGGARPGPALGHIFNLGHGILPQTPPDHARLLVDTVRELSEIQS